MNDARPEMQGTPLLSWSRMQLLLRVILLICVVSTPAIRAVAQEVEAIHLHLPGIGGKLPPDILMERGLIFAGVKAQIIIDDWTGEQRGLSALVNTNRHKFQSARIAKRITELRRAHPTARITVSGHSGGTGIVVWALSQLPEDVLIDDLILVAPALSPGYDLSPALARVRGRCFSFNSLGDVAVLGAGTRTMGTIDRVKTDAAGRVGFTTPATTQDISQYAKLRQVYYQAEFLKLANNGEHMGAMMSPFAARVLAPVILTGELPEWVKFTDGPVEAVVPAGEQTGSATQPSVVPAGS